MFSATTISLTTTWTPPSALLAMQCRPPGEDSVDRPAIPRTRLVLSAAQHSDALHDFRFTAPDISMLVHGFLLHATIFTEDRGRCNSDKVLEMLLMQLVFLLGWRCYARRLTYQIQFAAALCSMQVDCYTNLVDTIGRPELNAAPHGKLYILCGRLCTLLYCKNDEIPNDVWEIVK